MDKATEVRRNEIRIQGGEAAEEHSGGPLQYVFAQLSDPLAG